MSKPRSISFSIEEEAFSRIDIAYEEDGSKRLSLYQGEDELFIPIDKLEEFISIVRSIQKIMEICPVDW